MKHSASGSMISPVEVEGASVQSLYVDLCNLIVESRTPTRDARGYGDGTHCPPMLGYNSHTCDPTNAQCQKHQTIIHHLLEAVANNVFQIEVLLLPECCLDSKLKERIENKEYILVERWSMNFIYGKTESNIEVSQLLRAVRSFLHFSQLSAWLSSTSGKSPANICYWVNPKLEALCTKFKHEPEVHSFPICKVNEDLYGRVKVEFPARTQYIPIIPCSKHPPICRYSLREINKDSDLCENISLDPQIVMQLHKTCDTEQNKLTAINYVPEPTTVMLSPTSLLKTISAAIPDGGKTNRVLKHSNLQGNLLNSSTLSLDVKGKTLDIIPKKSSTFVCNYAETLSLGVSQENFCVTKRKLAKHLRKTEVKLKKMKKDVSTTLVSESLSPILSSDTYKLNQNTLKHSLRISDVPQASNLLDEKYSESSLLNSVETSLINLEKHALSSSHNLSRQLATNFKAFKQKDSDLNAKEKRVLPHKEICCDINLSSQILKSASAIKCTASLPQCTKASQLKEKVTLAKTGDEEFQENSYNTLINPSKDIKILELKHQKCPNDSIPFQYISESVSAGQKQEFANCHASTKVFSRSLKRKSLKQTKTNVCRNSEIMLSKRKCTSQLDSQTNVRKKSKAVDECNNLPSDSICNISNSHFSEAKQTYCLDSKGPDKKNSLEKYFLKRNKLEKQGSSEQSCSSWIHHSRTICNNSNSIIEDIASSNDIPKSNFYCEKDYSMKTHHIYPRKSSLICSKSSIHLQSLQNKDKKFQTQKTKSYKLFLDSNQMASEKDVRDISNVISENASDEKSISSWEHDYKVSNLLKANIEKPSFVASKEILMKRTLSKNTSMHKNPVLKKRKRNAEEKTVNPSLLKNSKLNKLFKFKKASCQNICKRKSNMPKSMTNHQFMKKSSSSQTVSKQSITLSLNQCQNNIFSTNVPNELISIPSNASANSTTELQRTALTGVNISKDICAKNDNCSAYQLGSHLNPLKMISLQNDHESSFVLNTPVPTASRNLCQITDENLECFPKRIAKFPKGRKLLMNFEESILKGCLPMVSNVKGFHAEIGASGSFCPNHLTLPADVSFYELGHPNQGTAPYVAHVSLTNSEYYLPKKGAVQVTLFNPSETVVKMFVINYDFSSMPPLCHTFIRQKTYSLPVGLNKEYPASQKWLRFIIHLRFASSKTGRISLHEDFKIVVLNKTNDDAASEFSQEPRELCSFLSVPMNPTFSNI